MPTFDEMFDAVYSAQDKDTIQHILRFWEPRVRQFAPPVYINHYYKQQALCREIKETRRRMRREFRAMNAAQKHEYMDYRNRFKDDFHNQTLIEEGLKAWAADCYLDRRDNGIIQLEWRRDNLPPAEIPISYE
uniref:Uncharacterized protein n=1 Tax=viral metagenome TaxID=1070528 RepID=A0A6C0D270_9ZZZZ